MSQLQIVYFFWASDAIKYMKYAFQLNDMIDFDNCGVVKGYLGLNCWSNDEIR